MGIKILTYTNKTVDVNDLKPEDIDIKDIAHSLSMQCRYGGHCSGFYSVAEHCVHLAEHALKVSNNRELAAVMLMHDATEAYVGDVVSQLKETMPEFKVLEDRVAKVIMEKFDLLRYWIAFQPPIHEFDKRICVDEMEQFFAEPPPFEQYPLDIQTKGWSPRRAKRYFLKTAAKLKLIEEEKEAWYVKLFYSMDHLVQEKIHWLTIRFHSIRAAKLLNSPRR